MTIRAMMRSDLARVVDIAKASLPEAWTLEGFTAELEKQTSIALVIGEPTFGFAIASSVAGELEIFAVAIDPSQRRAGAGTALLDALLRVPDVERSFLEVRASNAAAIALYERAGFRKVGTRECYYADGEDAVVMARSATGP